MGTWLRVLFLKNFINFILFFKSFVSSIVSIKACGFFFTVERCSLKYVYITSKNTTLCSSAHRMIYSIHRGGLTRGLYHDVAQLLRILMLHKMLWLETFPVVAIKVFCINLILHYVILIKIFFWTFIFINKTALFPALRTRHPPWPGVISICEQLSLKLFI